MSAPCPADPAYPGDLPCPADPACPADPPGPADPEQPAGSTSPLTALKVVEAVSVVEAEALAAQPVLRPGDFLLGRAHGFRHDVLRRGQRLRLRPEQRRYAGYTHAALVVSPYGDLIEAVGEGVHRSHVRSYAADEEYYRIVHIRATDEDRRQMVAFAEAVLARRAPYGFLSNVSTAFWAVTGSRLVFFLDGSYTCSGLVAAALERTASRLPTASARMMPAQLAILFGAPPPPPDPPRRRAAAIGRSGVRRRAGRGWGRRIRRRR